MAQPPWPIQVAVLLAALTGFGVGEASAQTFGPFTITSHYTYKIDCNEGELATCIEVGDQDNGHDLVYTVYVEREAPGQWAITGTVTGTAFLRGVYFGTLATCTEPVSGTVSGSGMVVSGQLSLSFQVDTPVPCWSENTGVSFSEALGDTATFVGDDIASVRLDHTERQESGIPGVYSQVAEKAVAGTMTLLRLPVLLVPGIGATYPGTPGGDLGWLLRRGVAPGSLRVDPLTRAYDDLIETFKSAGYVEGEDLFVVTYDWRLAPGPIDGSIDGTIDGGLTATGISDDLYEYGVDYFGVFLKRAAEAWARKYPEAPPLDAVDVVAHSTGGLVARTYIQSPAYGGEYEPGQPLPKVNKLIMIGVPNRGASKVWNILHDNWSADIAFHLVLSKIVLRAYVQVMEKGQQIVGPDHTITKAMLESPIACPQGPRVCFIDKYIPTARALLATYDFLDVGAGPASVNLDFLQRNSLLLDLNAGLDHVVTGDPNGFADLAAVTVIYGTNGDDDGGTPVQAVEGIGSDLSAGIVNFTDIGPRGARNNEVFYTDVVEENAGDGTVPLESSVGQFLTDSRVTLKPFTKGVNSTAKVKHVDLMSNPDVQREVLATLGVTGAAIHTGFFARQWGLIQCAASGCVAVQTDPVEGFVVDGVGRRLGYTASTGPLTEIPGSFWSGDADGMGWILGDLVPPLTLQLTGLGGDYMAQVTTLSSAGAGGIEVRGTLAAGEARSVAVPLTVVADTTNPTAILTAPESIPFGQDLTVAGDQSFDVGGTIVRYEWTLGGYPVVETATPSFTFAAGSYPLAPGLHDIQLVVVDDSGNQSSPVSRQVQVIGDTVNPTAVITGPAELVERHPLPVSGTGSIDPGGTIVVYRWRLDAYPLVETSQPTFTFTSAAYPLLAGPHVVTLTVVDASGNHSTPVQLQVSVVADTAPTAVLDTPSAIDLGDPLVVSGAGSTDAVGTIVRYIWQLDGSIEVETSAPSFTFTDPPYALGVGLHTVRLRVIDDAGQHSSTVQRQVEVRGDTTNPTAVLSAPTTIVEGEDLAVSATGSTDIGGAIVRYEWTLDAFAPVETDSPAFTFTAATYPLGDGEHTVQLVVVDDSGNRSSPDERRITVTARADTVQLHLRVEGLGGLPATVTVRATARYLTLPDGISDPQLPSAPPCANAADCLFAPRAGSTVVIDVAPGGTLLTGPFVAGWTGCDAQANGRCYLTLAENRVATVRVTRTRPVFAVGTTGGALFSSAAGPGVLAFAAARTAAGDLLGGGAVVAVSAAQYGCGAVATVERSGNRTTLVTRYGVKAPAQAGAAPLPGYACRITVTDATSRSGRDQYAIQVIAPSGAVELSATGNASFLAFVTLTNVPVVW
ncbi:MAG: PKD domain-containing protein [Vicinamibacterales bacterium]